MRVVRLDFGFCWRAVDRLRFVFFFFKQKTAYEMRISDWSSDVCSSDLVNDQRSHHLLDHRHCPPMSKTGTLECRVAEIAMARRRQIAKPSRFLKSADAVPRRSSR